MVTYPITVKRNYYHGHDQRRTLKARDHNEMASAIERKINELLLKQTETIRSYNWFEIALATGLAVESVKAIGYSIDCGSNGFTAWRHDMTYEQATASLRLK